MKDNDCVRAFKLLKQIQYECGRDCNYIALADVDELTSLLKNNLRISPTARERLSLELESEMKRYREWREKSKKQ